MPLPMTVIANALGVLDTELGTFKRWSDAFVMANGNPSLTREEISELFGALNEFYGYFSEQLDDREREPRDDLVSDVAHAEITGAEPLSRNERLQMLSQFLIAGHASLARTSARTH